MPGIVQFPRRTTDQADAPRLTGGSPVAPLPVVPLPVALSEVFAGTVGDAGAVGFALSRLANGKAPILWIQDRLSRRETGGPHLPGLGPGRSILLVEVTRPADVLVAAEEGLRCKSLSAVIAEVYGNPPALDFTATKRLALRAEATGVPCWLIRHGGTADLSAARDRWRITSLPAGPHPDDATSPGDPRWRVELFRSRDKPPGIWLARHDRAADRVDLSAAVPDGTLAEGAGTGGECRAR
jgi:protein ImuA